MGSPICSINALEKLVCSSCKTQYFYKVHDATVEENVADSGEESEDEWNYFKGNSAGADTTASSLKTDQEVAELTKTIEEDEEQDMSQLNPNAAEFVPISSPTRNVSSPACRALIDDPVLAQSPRRATPCDIDINVPNPVEFESEVKNRPSEVFNNGHDNETGHKLSSQKVMENLLNGKNLDEIEFYPSTPSKIVNRNPEEFHFGPNATPFSTPAKPLDQSEAVSTTALFGDESTASYLEGKTLEGTMLTDPASPSEKEDSMLLTKLKEQDPMSISFYQHENEHNPFDLNQVQQLPENIDEFIGNVENSDEKENINPTFTNEDMLGISQLPKTPEPENLTESLEEKEDLDVEKDINIELIQEICDLPLAASPSLEEVAKQPLPITPEPAESLEYEDIVEPQPEIIREIHEMEETDLCKISDSCLLTSSLNTSRKVLQVTEDNITCDKKMFEMDSSPETEELSQISDGGDEVPPLCKSPEITSDLDQFESDITEVVQEICQEKKTETLPGETLSEKGMVSGVAETAEMTCDLDHVESDIEIKNGEVIEIVTETKTYDAEILPKPQVDEVQILPEPKMSDVDDFIESKVDDIEVFPESKPGDIETFPESKVDDVEIFSESKVDDVEIFPESKVDDVEMFPESKVDDVEMFPESKVDDVEMFPESKVDDVKMFSESKVDVVEIIPESKVDDVDVLLESAINNMEMLPESKVDSLETVLKLETDYVEMLAESKEPNVEEMYQTLPSTNGEELDFVVQQKRDEMFETKPDISTEIIELEAFESLEKGERETTVMTAKEEIKGSEGLFGTSLETKSKSDDLCEKIESVFDQDRGEDIPKQVESQPSPTPICVDQQYSLTSESMEQQPSLILEVAELPASLTPEPTEPQYALTPKPTELQPVMSEPTELQPSVTPEPTEPQLSFTPEPSNDVLIKEDDLDVDIGTGEIKSDDKVSDDLRDLDSPMEDITTSIKDDVSSSEIIEEAKDISTEKDVIIPASFVLENNEPVLEASQPNLTKELIDACQLMIEEKTMEVASELSKEEAEVCEFLERSQVPEILSPISPATKLIDKSHSTLDQVKTDFIEKCNLEETAIVTTNEVTNEIKDNDMVQETITEAIKTDIIAPQYPDDDDIIITPSEETETVVEALIIEPKTKEVSKPDDSDKKIIYTTVAGATAAVVATGAAVAAKSKGKKSLDKKPPTKKTAPSKPGVTSSTTSKATTLKTTPRPATSKSLTSPTKSPVSSVKIATPKTPASKTGSLLNSTAKTPTKVTSTKSTPKADASPAGKLTEKKTPALTNGEIKGPTKPTMIAKKTSTGAKTPTTTPKTTSLRMSPTKAEVPKPLTKPAPKPAAISKTTTMTAKPKPTTLPSASSGGVTKTATTLKSTVTKATAATSPKTGTVPPKPRPISAPTARSRLVGSNTSKLKAPDTEKQIKDSVNKQLTTKSTVTSKTVSSATSRAMGTSTTTTLKKTETKGPTTTRTTTTKTTIKAMKKPAEITRLVGKAKPAMTKISVKPQENGTTEHVTTVVQETTAILTTEPQLLKDLSPIENKFIIDNSQVTENNVAD